MTSKVQILEIDAGSDDQRLDNYLIKILKGAPKSLIYRIIRKGEVRVNKGRAKPETRLKIGDRVRVPPVKIEAKVEHKPGAGLLSVLRESILYESDALLVVNKPSGLAVHGGSGVKLGLIESLRALFEEGTYLELVHRLDRETSGCVMIAKSRPMLRHLQALLRETGQIQKRYYALVSGQWPKRREHVKAPLHRREEQGGERFVDVDPIQGKPSLTRFRVIERFESSSLVEASPITGRTHQIRVHARHCGHPLLGDEKYGDVEANRRLRTLGLKRLFLHAHALEIPLPNGKRISVEAPLPEDLLECLNRLRG